MTRSDLPSPETLEEVRRLAGSAATILGAARLVGGQRAETWRVDTESPAASVVVRQFPVGDPAPCASSACCGPSTGSAGWRRRSWAAIWTGDGRGIRFRSVRVASIWAGAGSTSCWAVARSHDIVASWGPNYRPLGRADLDEDELRRRHAQWAARIRAQA
jgi:hypothetical protein